jgi:DNA-binding NarL/FixJ family response regulator
VRTRSAGTVSEVPRSRPEIRRIALDGDLELVVVETAAHEVDVEALTEDEEEVALLVADGHDDPSIAARRGTSVETARRQRSSVYAKFEVKTPEELARKLLG